MSTRLLAAGLIAMGCSAGDLLDPSVTPGTFESDPILVVKCNNFDECLAAAGQACPHGFEVLAIPDKFTLGSVRWVYRIGIKCTVQVAP